MSAAFASPCLPFGVQAEMFTQAKVAETHRHFSRIFLKRGTNAEAEEALRVTGRAVELLAAAISPYDLETAGGEQKSGVEDPRLPP